MVPFGAGYLPITVIPRSLSSTRICASKKATFNNMKTELDIFFFAWNFDWSCTVFFMLHFDIVSQRNSRNIMLHILLLCHLDDKIEVDLNKYIPCYVFHSETMGRYCSCSSHLFGSCEVAKTVRFYRFRCLCEKGLGRKIGGATAIYLE